MSADHLSVRAHVWLMAGDESLVGPGRIELLEAIADTGSIRQAALRMGMSYRAAWNAVDAINRRMNAVMVTRLAGGRRGGGATLTDDARRLIRTFREIERRHAGYVEALNNALGDLLSPGSG
ncbi:MAG: LysR family transcriptional regulator [Nevskiales bacterium]|nr:LysR family transcriptional regulator [Nevskiales bacterium]